MWVKLDDGFWCHPKVALCSLSAIGLHAKAMSYAGQQLTDGLIPEQVLSMFCAGVEGANILQELLDAGLWLDAADGYRINNFSKYNPKKSAVQKKRTAARKRMQNVRANKRRTDNEVHTNKPRSSQGVRSTSRARFPDPTRPDPTLNKEKDARERAGVSAGKGKRKSGPFTTDAYGALMRFNEVHRQGMRELKSAAYLSMADALLKTHALADLHVVTGWSWAVGNLDVADPAHDHQAKCCLTSNPAALWRPSKFQEKLDKARDWESSDSLTLTNALKSWTHVGLRDQQPDGWFDELCRRKPITEWGDVFMADIADHPQVAVEIARRNGVAA